MLMKGTLVLGLKPGFVMFCWVFDWQGYDTRKIIHIYDVTAYGLPKEKKKISKNTKTKHYTIKQVM